LHQTVVLLTVEQATTPVVKEESRYRLQTLSEGFYKLIVTFGFMEEPQLLPVLRAVSQREHIPLDVDDATYYVGHETIMSKNGGIHRVPEAIFSYLNRNAVQEESRYGMPAGQVVEIGTQVYL
jgi:KUP system potassium uptake protein